MVAATARRIAGALRTMVTPLLGPTDLVDPRAQPGTIHSRQDCLLDPRCARDERQRAMDQWVGAGATLVAVSLALPGPQLPPGASALFAWALGELRRRLPAARQVHATVDALGPFELWSTPGAATTVKSRCIKVEEAQPAARLIDLDVYSPEGTPVDRESLYAPARVCFCCFEPARECIRAGRHRPEDVVARAIGLLGMFRA